MPLNAEGQIAGDLFAGFGESLVASDDVRRAMLLTYGAMAHLCTRGGWMAVAARDPLQ
ncbi:MAG: hypothetical protein WDN06_07975 [Asticcacaulis sp.]